jgi:hypothetical protein
MVIARMNLSRSPSKDGSFGRERGGRATTTCVYTALLNGYEELNEQPAARDSSVDFICFTDDPGLTSASWDVRVVKPLLPGDPVRSQRYLKICAHRALPQYDVSLYVDNTVLLRRPPQEVLHELLGESTLALVRHGFRPTVRAEFDEVVALGLDAATVCGEQLEHYTIHDPGALTLPPLWGGILGRRHNDAGVAAAMERWFAHVLRYSRRDQLSLWYALRSEGVRPVVHTLDIHQSEFHRWPVARGRDRVRGGTPAALALERRLRLLEDERTQLAQQLTAIHSTRSWRWTAPIRYVRSRLTTADSPREARGAEDAS